jgi:hypothetical protein
VRYTFLTAASCKEREIVESRDGTVLLLGRSGTGKTVCISSRIHYDRHLATDASFSQLFVARSRRICNYVRETLSDLEPNDESVRRRLDFQTFNNLIVLCEDDVGGSKAVYRNFPKRVDFARFKRDFPTLIESSGLDPLVVWTQIRSSIKGSIRAVVKDKPLTLAEYLDFEVIGARRSRLNSDQRESAYRAFEVYEKHIRELGLWDDCDRVQSLLTLWKSHDSEHLAYQRIYVDEIQDFTQAEIALFYQLCRSGHLFFAGDPAQSVVEGVEFRFEEVKSVVYNLLPVDLHARYMPKKVEKVTINFRSHSGILNVASAVLDRLFVAFKDCAPDLKSKDSGLFNGPRPGLYENIGRIGLIDLVSKIDGAVLLAMSDGEVELLRKAVPKTVVVLSIRDSKGLEFPDVILVDFFSGLPALHQIPWRSLLGDRENLSDFQEQYPEIETQLKQLYTAITRCSHRLFFAETRPSLAGQNFVKWVTKRDLVVKQNVAALKGVVKTAYEWRSTGIEYAMNAETFDSLDNAVFWLSKALECFERGEAQELETRARLHLKSFTFRKEIEKGVDQDDTDELLKKSAELLEHLIESGLRREAAKVCHSLQNLQVLDDYILSRFREMIRFLPEPD